MKKSFGEIKQIFGIGAVCCLFLLFITTISPKNSESTNSDYWVDMVLAETPSFQHKYLKGDVYWVELRFENESLTYQINGIDYKYLDKERLKNDIIPGDTLAVLVSGLDILSLTKGREEYMDLDKAQFHKVKNKIFSRIVFATGFFFCLLPLFFSKAPKLTVFYIQFELDFGWLLAFAMVLALIAANVLVGIEFVS